VPSNRITEEKLKEILISIYDRIRIECDLEVVIGVGNNVSYLEDIRTSRNEASSAVSAARMENRKEFFYFFKDQGLYSFISRVEDNKFLDDFVEEHLGRLVRDDEVKNGKLCETLETYLNKNCSIKDTAEALFLHRNTLNYRLGRIREILDIDLGDLENCLNLKLAFLIRHYRAMYTMNK
jgi:PucR family transcriptional regulator, proline-responsive transcriptional activator